MQLVAKKFINLYEISLLYFLILFIFTTYTLIKCKTASIISSC
jgi:hypothetical protein